MELIYSILETLPSEANACLYDRDMLAKPINGKTPLTLAAEYGHERIVSMLLAFGAAISQPDDKSRTALCLAAENGHSGVVEQLLAAGAEVDADVELNLLKTKYFPCRRTPSDFAVYECAAVLNTRVKEAVYRL